ncbi:MAG: hypothetical protein V3W41_08735 [Planctomycetota bacterium]
MSMNRLWMTALVCGFFAMGLTVACESTGDMNSPENLAGQIDHEGAEVGAVSALIGLDRSRIFTAAQAALSGQGRLLGAWPESGRLEGVVQASSVVVSLLPVDRGLTRLLIEAAPMAGSGDVSSIAAALLQSTIAQLTGVPTGF